MKHPRLAAAQFQRPAFLQRIFCLFAITLCHSALADTRCESKAATLESVAGVVEWSSTDNHWQPAVRGDTFCYGDRIRILEQRAALRLANDTVVRLRENSVVTLMPEDKGFWIELLQGAGHFLSRTPKQLTIKAAYLNAAIDGTEFVVTTEEQSNRVAVFEGDVRVFNRYGEVRLGEGTETTATATTAPDPARSIRLRDAAEWILHYPPLIIQNQTLAGVSPLIDQERYGEALNALTQQAMTSGAATLAASLALVSGQPSEADRLLGIALQQNPQSADALALQALKALTAGDDQTALLQTTRLLQTDPQNVSVLLAHAYALQSQGKIEEALEINRKALSLSPDNLFILARTAELELSTGNTRAARQLIDRTLKKAPNHSRLNTLAGFIALNRFANKDAQTYFRTAITSNDSEPLARLGLALALIQKGKIEAGRAQMEMAVLLDPGSSLLRSYLGKTYAAQDQNDWADTQYQLAKNLDPNDPTPWFYEGINQKVSGHPLKALESFRESQRLNESRATYRTQRLLNEDAASRMARIGHTYRELGLTQRMIDFGIDAQTRAAENANGYRLLAEAYAKNNEYESLRASARLRAVALDPLGVPPLPFAFSESGLFVKSGATPVDLGLNEYSRIFTQTGLYGALSGLYGSQSTSAYDVNIGGTGKNFDFGIGKYHYDSDGFRENGDAEYDISGILGRWQVLGSLVMFGEYVERREKTGDLRLRFDLENFEPGLRRDLTNRTVRIGVTIDIHNNGKLLAIYSSGQGSLNTDDAFTSEDQKKNKNIDAAYILSKNNIRLISGFSASSIDIKSYDLSEGNIKSDDTLYYRESQRAQELYTYISFDLENLNLQMTAGGDLYKDESEISLGSDEIPIDNNWKELPKLGLAWSPSSKLSVSASKFKSIARPFEIQTSLKPTHIQLSPQIIDGTNGSEYDNLATKISYTPSTRLLIGAINSEIELLEPVFSYGLTVETIQRSVDKRESKIYSDWQALDNVILSLSFDRESANREIDESIPIETIPMELRTTKTEMILSYSRQSLLFSAKLSQIKQKYLAEIWLVDEFQISQQQDKFTTIDLSIKYMLPRSSGEVSLKINNIFDQNFSYANFNIHTLKPSVIDLIPSRNAQILISYVLD